MKSILFLGYSNLLKSRILPILAKVGFEEVSIAKYHGQEWDDDFKSYEIPVTYYNNYSEGLENFSGELVYISTVNSTHAEFARTSLNLGFNTIVDKPATISYEEAWELVNLAKLKHLFFGESTVYLMHPQLTVAKNIFSLYEDIPKLLTVHFTMPPFAPTNFRYQRILGGGAIMDTAPYAVSIGRYFFGSKPETVTCHISEQTQDGLDIQYSLLMSYPNGKTMVGHFGFNTEYINQVYIMGNRTNVLINRIFTIPDNLENELTVNHLNQASIIKAPAANNFEIYLKTVIDTIKNGIYDQVYQDLLWDAEVRNMIINNIN